MSETFVCCNLPARSWTGKRVDIPVFVFECDFILSFEYIETRDRLDKSAECEGNYGWNLMATVIVPDKIVERKGIISTENGRCCQWSCLILSSKVPSWSPKPCREKWNPPCIVLDTVSLLIQDAWTANTLDYIFDGAYDSYWGSKRGIPRAIPWLLCAQLYQDAHGTSTTHSHPPNVAPSLF